MTDNGARPGPVSLTMVRRLRADRARVFTALTDPAQLAKWWGPKGCHCPDPEVDLRVGGAYRLDMHGESGAFHPLTGRYLEIEPPSRLVFTWTWGRGGYAGIETTVAIDLVERAPGETELTLTHSGFTDDDMSADHEDGWGGTFDCLAQIVEDT